MREIRSSGSVEGVLSDGHPYSDSNADSGLRRPARQRYVCENGVLRGCACPARDSARGIGRKKTCWNYSLPRSGLIQRAAY
jgi:hypothetical protein